MKATIALSFVVALAASICNLRADEPEITPIGGERQLFLDDQYLIDSLDSVEVLVHQPVRRNICDFRNRPWEGNGCRFGSVIYDDQAKIYRMYYTATQSEHIQPWNSRIGIAYLESENGVDWTYRPLNLVEWDGSTENNLILNQVMTFSPFIDTNPNAKADERYKAISADGSHKMTTWKSVDGIRWERTNEGQEYAPGTPNAFDSQNIAFWSVKEGKYVAYYRATDPRGFRSIERATSDDFLHWTKESLLQYPQEQVPHTNRGEFYTNEIYPYYRAPQIYLGFPARYNDNQMTESFKYLPEQEERAARMAPNPRFGTVTPDSVFFSSRDGINFRVSNDVFLAPGLKTKNNWSYGDNYIFHQMVETQSTDIDEGRELSLYANESSFTGDGVIVRRYSLRVDGFASLHAKTKSGVAVLKPITFEGKELSLNIATSGFGRAFVELCDLEGKPYPGFSKDECDVIYGDSLDRRASWKGNYDVSSLAGKPVVVKFYLCESDVYSMAFVK